VFQTISDAQSWQVFFAFNVLTSFLLATTHFYILK